MNKKLSLLLLLFSVGLLTALAAGPVFAGNHGGGSHPVVPPGGGPDGQIVPGKFIVLVKDGHNPVTVATDNGVTPGHVYRAAVNGFSAAANDDKLGRLRADERVLVVENERIWRLNGHCVSPNQCLPTGIDRIESPNGGGVTVDIDVAIIDTGIDLHLDLNRAGGMNFTGGPGSKFDDKAGHGTHVAGTVGALDNGYGVVGVAPGANLWAVKVCKNICLTSDMVAGINEVAACKKKAVNGTGTCNMRTEGINFAVATMSISHSDDGNPCTGSSGAVHEAFCALVDEGVVVTLSAGNADRLKADYPEVISVAAIADFDGKGGADATTAECSVGSEKDDTLADFSNYGVDIAAPGWCIFSTYKDGGLAWMSGTSMATPHVAGAVALYLHAHGLAPATDAAGVNAIKDAIIGAALPQSDACSYTNEKSSSERLLFVNASTDHSSAPTHDGFHGDGSCEGAVATPLSITTTSLPVGTEGVEYSATVEATGGMGAYTWAKYGTWPAGLGLNTATGEISITQTTAGTYNFTVEVTDDAATDTQALSITINEADTTAPLISGPGYTNITATLADITWTTDEPSDSVVHYGLATDDLSSTASVGALVTGHAVGLSGLTAETTYYYEVHSTDGSDNTATDDNNTEFYSFTTLAAPTTATSVSVSSVTYTTSGGKDGDKHLSITVALVDDLGGAVSGASVSIDLKRDGTTIASGTAPTGATGMVAWTLNNAALGCYQTTVSDVTASGLTWDPNDPANTSADFLHKVVICP